MIHLLDMTTNNVITVTTTVNAPIEKVWECWVNPVHITGWNFASDDWGCPQASSNLEEGGTFSYIMAAKDGSFSFDFGGTFTKVVPGSEIAYTTGDGRTVSVIFTESQEGVVITETFEMEDQNPREMQEAGWQSILNNFK